MKVSMHLTMGSGFKAFQLTTSQATKAPRIAIKLVEAPTAGEFEHIAEKRMPPNPPTIQIRSIFRGPTTLSSIDPKISAKREFQRIWRKLAWRNIGMKNLNT